MSDTDSKQKDPQDEPQAPPAAPNTLPSADEQVPPIPAEEPYKIHPSAADGTTERPTPPEGVVEEYYIGDWSGRPLYGCPGCSYSVVGTQPNGEDGSGQVGFHLETKAASGDPAHFAVLHPAEA